MARMNQALDRLANMRLQMLITAEQAVPWEEFSVRARAWLNEAYRRRDLNPSATALEVLQLRLTETQNRYALMEALVDAAKALSKVLAPEQQRIMDFYLPPILAS